MNMAKAGRRIGLSFSVILLVFYFFPTKGLAQLVNIATRGFVGSGDNVMIAGFIIGGTAPVQVLIKGRGPSMSGAPFFVPGTLGIPLYKFSPGNQLSRKTITGNQCNRQKLRQPALILVGPIQVKQWLLQTVL